jgi:hypothetical protein
VAEQGTEPVPVGFNQPRHDQQTRDIAEAVTIAIEERGLRTVAAVGERVAIVETKMVGLEKDTTVIRSTLHTINTELQKTVVHEANCARSLALIAEQTKCVPEIVSSLTGFEDLKPKLLRVIEESNARRSAWKVVLLIGSGIVGAATALGMLATLLAALPSLLHH